jgi:hypothetical protein
MAPPTDASTDGTDETTTNGTSRRGFIGGVAALAATASIGAVGTTAASEHDPSDVEILNYALTLEHLENEFYIAQLDQFSERDFQRSALLDEFGFGMRFTARDYLRTVQEHEQAHVDFLTSAISDAGGEPATAATEYNFGAPLGKDGIDTVSEFATVAEVLESTGVDAYAGAAPLIDNAEAYVPPALQIHSVEANHAAYLRNLNGGTPMPTAFNEAQTMDEVLEAIGPIIVEE